MECGKVRCVTDRGHARPRFETSQAPTKEPEYFYKYFALKFRCFCTISFVFGVVVGLWSVAKWVATSAASLQDHRSNPAKSREKKQRIT